MVCSGGARIRGNMHEMVVDKNSVEVIKFTDGWVGKNVK